MTHMREEWTTIFIDGVERQGFFDGAVLFVDADELPQRRCRAIRMAPEVWRYLDGGGAVRTGGSLIRRSPPLVKATPRPPRSLLSKLVAVVKEHYK